MIPLSKIHIIKLVIILQEMTEPTKCMYHIQLKHRIWGPYFAVIMMLRVVPKIIVNVKNNSIVQLSETSQQN